MSGPDPFDRPAWADRFIKPSPVVLRQALVAPQRRQFDAARKHLLNLGHMREDVSWYGECWKWSLEYRTRQSKAAVDPLALIIPCPDDLQLALPLDREFLATLPMKRMRRAVRDGLELAQAPFDTRWSVWSLGVGAGSAASLLDDLQDLIEMKMQHLAKRVG